MPEYRWLLGLGGAGIPNVGGDNNDSSMIALQFRGTEKFDNRRTEFGLLLSFYVTMASLLKEYPVVEGTGDDSTTTETTDPDLTTPTELEPFKSAIAFYGVFAHNFWGRVESYNAVRSGFHVGLGALLAPSYMAPTARVGWDLYFGRRFAFTIGGIYIAPSRVLVSGEFKETTGGSGGEAVLSFNY